MLPLLYVKYLIASWLCPTPEDVDVVERPGRLGTAAEKQVRLRVPPAVRFVRIQILYQTDTIYTVRWMER